MPSDESPIVGSLRSADGAGVVRLEALLPVGVEDAWAALIEPARLRQWLGDLDGDFRSGGELHARFYATGWDGVLRVETCEPQARLLLQTTSEGEPDCTIEVTLRADGDRTSVVVEDRGLPLDQLAAYGAGDQVLVEDLARHLGGHPRGEAMARWQELHPNYLDLAAAIG
jgi:uncharacterized protein YndB with AHSA1/START domain